MKGSSKTHVGKLLRKYFNDFLSEYLKESRRKSFRMSPKESLWKSLRNYLRIDLGCVASMFERNQKRKDTENQQRKRERKIKFIDVSIEGSSSD